MGIEVELVYSNVEAKDLLDKHSFFCVSIFLVELIVEREGVLDRNVSLKPISKRSAGGRRQ